MAILVTSASGLNGDGYGALLQFDLDGKPRGSFSDDERISDPRGLGVNRDEGLLFLNDKERVLALDPGGRVVRDTGSIVGLDPGGGNFGPDGRYYVTLRTLRTISAFTTALNGPPEHVLPVDVVPFPRGFAFGRDGTLFLSSGVGPNGQGNNTILAFAPDGSPRQGWHVEDPGLSPLDLLIAPNGNVLVSSEHPFGASDAVGTIREYDATDGRLIRVFSKNGPDRLRKPRGLRLGPDGRLYCVTQDEVVAFSFDTGKYLGPAIRMARLHGQAIIFFP